MKKLLSVLCLAIVIASFLTAAAPMPNATFTLVQGLPATMNVGDTYTAVVHVESDQEFLFAQALPSALYVGKGVVAVQGGDHVGRGTSATLSITYTAKSSTAKMINGMTTVHMVVGVRYKGGYVAVYDYSVDITVP